MIVPFGGVFLVTQDFYDEMNSSYTGCNDYPMQGFAMKRYIFLVVNRSIHVQLVIHDFMVIMS